MTSDRCLQSPQGGFRVARLHFGGVGPYNRDLTIVGLHRMFFVLGALNYCCKTRTHIPDI